MSNVPLSVRKHRDPLLRRLRLTDGNGNEVDLEREFRDCKVVGFFFGAQWSGVIRDYYKLVDEFSRKHPHQYKTVFVSVDTDEESFKASTMYKPWLHMEWNDGSNLPATREDLPPLPIELSRSEDFLLAAEPDLDSSLSLEDPTGTAYLRPFSRVYLAEKFSVLGIPSLVVYHLGKREVIDHNVRIGKLMAGQEERTWTKWLEGSGTAVSVRELAHGLRWICYFALLAIGFWAVVNYTGMLEGGGFVKMLSNLIGRGDSVEGLVHSPF